MLLPDVPRPAFHGSLHIVSLYGLRTGLVQADSIARWTPLGPSLSRPLDACFGREMWFLQEQLVCLCATNTAEGMRFFLGGLLLQDPGVCQSGLVLSGRR